MHQLELFRKLIYFTSVDAHMVNMFKAQNWCKQTCTIYVQRKSYRTSVKVNIYNICVTHSYPNNDVKYMRNTKTTVLVIQ